VLTVHYYLLTSHIFGFSDFFEDRSQFIRKQQNPTYLAVGFAYFDGYAWLPPTPHPASPSGGAVYSADRLVYTSYERVVVFIRASPMQPNGGELSGRGSLVR
jgi:hypothetical protein